jgi:hypothetical protein
MCGVSFTFFVSMYCGLLDEGLPSAYRSVPTFAMSAGFNVDAMAAEMRAAAIEGRAPRQQKNGRRISHLKNLR